MIAVRHHPELVTPALLAWLAGLTGGTSETLVPAGWLPDYDDAGQSSRWLSESPPLEPLLARLAAAVCPGVEFESALLRGYRDGAAVTPCHTDRHATGLTMIFSLGATRTFRVHRVPAGTLPLGSCGDPDLDTVNIACPAGTALVLDESFQEGWHHQVAADPGVTEERFSLVFRTRPTPRPS